MKIYGIIIKLVRCVLVITVLSFGINNIISGNAAGAAVFSNSVSTEITVEDIMNNHIPRSSGAILHSDNLEFKGKFKKDVIPELTNGMKQMGWIEATAIKQGSIQYFIKEIDRQIVKVSMIAAQRGGPEQENTSTFVYFRIVPQNMNR